MFRIVHPNRWFIWTLVIVLIMAVFVWYKIEMVIIEADERAMDVQLSTKFFEQKK